MASEATSQPSPRHASGASASANATMPIASRARPGQSRRGGALRVSHQPEPAPISTLTVASSVLSVIASQTIAAAVAPLMATRRKA